MHRTVRIGAAAGFVHNWAFLVARDKTGVGPIPQDRARTRRNLSANVTTVFLA